MFTSAINAANVQVENDELSEKYLQWRCVLGYLNFLDLLRISDRPGPRGLLVIIKSKESVIKKEANKKEVNKKIPTF